MIAWNVTDVRLNRLVERFNDARTVATNLLNPDMITMTVNGNDKICAWSCMYTYIGDKLAGRPVAGPIRASDNLLQIIGKMKLVPAPKWQVSLGLAAPGSKVKTFVAGSMLQTIAMGLMARYFPPSWPSRSASWLPTISCHVSRAEQSSITLRAPF